MRSSKGEHFQGLWGICLSDTIHIKNSMCWPVPQIDVDRAASGDRGWVEEETMWLAYEEFNWLLYLDSTWIFVKWFKINYFVNLGTLWGRAYYLHFWEEKCKDQRNWISCLKSTTYKGQLWSLHLSVQVSGSSYHNSNKLWIWGY